MPIGGSSQNTNSLRCGEVGCGDPAPVGGEGRCVAHADRETLRRLLAGSSPSRPLDLRHATVADGLLSRMVAAAPTDAQGRPVFKSVLFGGATFVGPARFDGVAFLDASFDEARFTDEACFDEAVFQGQARFGRAVFGAAAGFARARFEGQSWFAGASFGTTADFSDATLAGPAWFGAAAFAGDARFLRTSFASDAIFVEGRFGCHTSFAEADFTGQVTLTSATFNHEPRYDGARFRGPGGAPKAAVKQAAWAGAPLASWPERVGAALLDHLAIAGLVLVALVATRAAFAGMGPLLLALAVAAGGAVIVHNLVEQGYTGQSFGKRTLGLCLVGKRDGMPVGVRTSVLRYGLHVVDTLPGLVGWFAPLWSSTRQTFADRMATTVVVRQGGWSGASPSRPAGVPASGFG